MILVIDVGNTNIVLGIYDGKKLVKSWRKSTDQSSSADEIGMFMVQLLKFNNIDTSQIEDVIISSVVPPVMYSLERGIQRYLGITPVVVGPGIKTGINIKYDNPKEVGADRIVNAVAVLENYGGPAIVIDFGTATTFCAISANYDYLGGVICPGIKISMDALISHTAKLPRIELLKPDKIIGKNTISSMQSGLIYGYVGQVDYIVNRIKEEMALGDDVKVIATGGMARLISEESKTIQRVDHYLTLEGLRILYEKNFPGGK